jgi:hypothetical protein
LACTDSGQLYARAVSRSLYVTKPVAVDYLIRVVSSICRTQGQASVRRHQTLQLVEPARPNYDLEPDGRSFVMMRSVERVPTHLRVTNSWRTATAK